jgi:hypothetical protein
MAAAGVGWRDGKSHGTEPDAIEAIKLCLDHGANINAVADKGQNALQGASLRGADTVIAWLMSHGADVNAKDKVVQTFSAKVSALGTSTVPASLACNACSGAFTATSSASWVVITSIAEGSVHFNVFSNTSSSPRKAVIQVEGARNKATLTIDQDGSTAPVLNRKIVYLYQHLLRREPDASEFALWTGQGAAALARMIADVFDNSLDKTMLYNLILERAPTPSELDLDLAELIGSAEFLAKFQ